jgi:LacI family transcriptional regulator
MVAGMELARMVAHQQGRATIHDVARLAGVSIASVSRALTGARKVRPEVAERVRSAAEQLGYQTDQVGRSLRRQETQTIGLVIADITNPFFPALVQAVEGELREAGLGVLLADAQNDPEIEASGVRLLLGRRVDALLITPVDRRRSAAAVAAAARAIPVVQLDRFAALDVHYVGMDHDRAIADVLAHLAGTGRRHLALIGSDPSMSTSWDRQTAFTARAAEIDPVAPKRVQVGDYSVEWGRLAAGRIVDRWPEVDAIVCANDLIGLGALQELHRRGIAIPDRVAVTGFDDTLLAVASEPPLTSVRQPVARMARQAVEIVVDGTPDDTPIRVSMTAELIIRASSGG